MKKLGLINYEGDCLRAVKTPSGIEIIDQYNEKLVVLKKPELQKFLEGTVEITDSKGKVWNYLKESVESKPKPEKLQKFLLD